MLLCQSSRPYRSFPWSSSQLPLHSFRPPEGSLLLGSIWFYSPGCAPARASGTHSSHQYRCTKRSASARIWSGIPAARPSHYVTKTSSKTPRSIFRSARVQSSGKSYRTHHSLFSSSHWAFRFLLERSLQLAEPPVQKSDRYIRILPVKFRTESWLGTWHGTRKSCICSFKF